MQPTRIHNWVDDELENVDLGDTRLKTRLIRIVNSLSSNPTQSIPANCNAWSEVKASYRFFDNSKVSASKIISPHYESTKKRIRDEKCVLFLQDTTDIDFTGKASLVGMDYTGSTQESQKNMKGFFLHPTIAVTPQGLCLGTIDYQIWTRETPPSTMKKASSYRDMIEDKESIKWINSYEKTKEIAKDIPETLCINIGDSESDIYEFFLEYDNNIPNAHFISRSKNNRQTMLATKTWNEILSKDSSGEIEFVLPEGSGRKSRLIKQEIRFGQIQLKAPARKNKKLEHITVNLVAATEVNVPRGEKWFLVTSLEIKCVEDAVKIIDYYLCRWQIEIYFKVIKSECQIEKLQLEHIDRIKNCLAIYLIITWRILFTTMRLMNMRSLRTITK